MKKEDKDEVSAQTWNQIGFYIIQADCPVCKRPTIMVRTLLAPNNNFRCQNCNEVFEQKIVFGKATK